MLYDSEVRSPSGRLIRWSSPEGTVEGGPPNLFRMEFREFSLKFESNDVRIHVGSGKKRAHGKERVHINCRGMFKGLGLEEANKRTYALLVRIRGLIK